MKIYVARCQDIAYQIPYQIPYQNNSLTNAKLLLHIIFTHKLYTVYMTRYILLCIIVGVSPYTDNNV